MNVLRTTDSEGSHHATQVTVAKLVTEYRKVSCLNFMSSETHTTGPKKWVQKLKALKPRRIYEYILLRFIQRKNRRESLHHLPINNLRTIIRFIHDQDKMNTCAYKTLTELHKREFNFAIDPASSTRPKEENRNSPASRSTSWTCPPHVGVVQNRSKLRKVFQCLQSPKAAS